MNARCGLIVNVTPLEPGWEGYLTLEISNTTPLPAKVYANEGIAQLLFFAGDVSFVKPAMPTKKANIKLSKASSCPSSKNLHVQFEQLSHPAMFYSNHKNSNTKNERSNKNIAESVIRSQSAVRW